MSAGRRMSTWLAGRKTFTPMSTSSPPLILRVTMPVTTSPSWTVSITFSQASIFSALRLLSVIMPRESSTRPWTSSTSSISTLMLGAGLGRRLVLLPLVAEDDAFALVTHVDQHEVAFDAEHAALDDLVQLHFLGRPGDLLGRDALQRGVQFCCHSSSLRSSPRIRLRLTIIPIVTRSQLPRSPGLLTPENSLRTIGES